MSDAVLSLFRQSGALLRRNFIFRFGLHTWQFRESAFLVRDAGIATSARSRLIDKLRCTQRNAVISPTLQGIVFGQEVGRSLGNRPHPAGRWHGSLMVSVSGLHYS